MRKILALDTDELVKRAKGQLVLFPTQPYRLMAEKINYRQISLKNVRFFFMDEYVDDEKDAVRDPADAVGDRPFRSSTPPATRRGSPSCRQCCRERRRRREAQTP